MNSTYNNIDNKSSNCLSENQMVDFIENRISTNDKLLLKNHIASCELCATALEGYQTSKLSGNQIKTINKSIRSKISTTNYSGFIKYFGIGLVAVSLITLLLFKLSPNDTKVSNEVHISEQTTDYTAIEPLTDEAFYYDEQEENIETIESSSSESQLTKTNTTAGKKTVERDEEQLEKIELKPTALKKEVSTLPKYSGLRKTLSISELHQFKIIDYSKEYGNNPLVLIPSMQSVTADKEDEHKYEKHEIIDMGFKKPYAEVLSQAIMYLKEEKHYQANVYFNYILDMDDENQNALFYGGLSNYYMNNYNYTIAAFDKIIDSENQTFIPEAKWYKAKSLKALGKEKELKKLLLEIIEDDDFYKEKAFIVLQSLD